MTLQPNSVTEGDYWVIRLNETTTVRVIWIEQPYLVSLMLPYMFYVDYVKLSFTWQFPLHLAAVPVALVPSRGRVIAQW